MATKGNGKTYQWLHIHVDYPHEDWCLVWPFARDKHGRGMRHHGGNVRRLVPEEIKAIKDARGFQTQCQLVAKFGISEGTVSDIWHGRSHAGDSKVKHWKPEEDAKLTDAINRGMSHREAAVVVGRPHQATTARASRLGLKSKWVQPTAPTPHF